MKGKKTAALFLTLSLFAGLAGCGMNIAPTEASAFSAAETSGTAMEPVTDRDITVSKTTGVFSLTTDDGVFETDGSVYTITSAGTYVLTGLLEGQILVDAGEDDEVVLELAGTTITCAGDSPIKVVSAGSTDISAKSGTENVINDTRSAKTAEDDAQGEGAIYAVCDLKIKGGGVLAVNASYNNGIHTTKDLEIRKLTLKCTAYNNALKGNDSVSVISGAVVAISTNGDGVKTENTDLNKNGAVRGDIVLTGGSIAVYAAGDGFQAAHDFETAAGEDGAAPTVLIYTGAYSGYTASDAAETSCKGIKAGNELRIRDGNIIVQSYDDGLHADSGASFGDGTEGQGTIAVSGGTVTLNVYAPENKTMGGRAERRGGGGQQTVSGADGIHANGTLSISGGMIDIESAYEGLEANVINISGGRTCVLAGDDGVNACKGAQTPLVNVTGGYLDVTVPANGDVDGIDSNGSYKQTGGVVIARGPSSDMAAAIDADGQVSVTGGTLILLGGGRVSTGGAVTAHKLSLHAAGSHTVSIDGTSYTVTNEYAYGRTVCYSDGSVSS
ncbi:MAG: carbohydrate-binding domain-containing protein [Clostridia bacterium]|nr:carbohydrate-binding domain-containing protein [Clostridia bacterium]